MAFTGEEREFCTMHFEATRSIKMTMIKFTRKFKKMSPSNKSIKKWHSNFVNTGNSTTARKAPPPTVCTAEAAEAISRHFKENPHCSMRRASLALGMKMPSVQKNLKSNNRYPYKINIVQKLSNRWVGRGSSNMLWPPCSPILSPVTSSFGDLSSQKFTVSDR